MRMAMASKKWSCAGVLLMVFALGSMQQVVAGPLSPEEARGKRIFLDGQSEMGRMITARVGRSSTPMPGKTFPAPAVTAWTAEAVLKAVSCRPILHGTV